MDRSSGFGSTSSYSSPYSDSLSLRLPYTVKLATERKSLTHYTKGTQSPRASTTLLLKHRYQASGIRYQIYAKWRCAPQTCSDPRFLSSDPRFNRKAVEARGSHCLYACGFRIYFTPLPGFFSPFPHGTGSLSVDHEYLALEDGPPIFRQDSTCPALLVSRLVPPPAFRIRGYHPLWPDFPDRFAKPVAKTRRLLPFRSPLLWQSRLISFPLAT